jgi:hypothetical protein
VSIGFRLRRWSSARGTSYISGGYLDDEKSAAVNATPPLATPPAGPSQDPTGAGMIPALAGPLLASRAAASPPPSDERVLWTDSPIYDTLFDFYQSWVQA